MLTTFQKDIQKAYYNKGRDVIEATGHLQCEASELAELLLKKKWYNKDFTREQLASEAGDILNFLTFILQTYGCTLEEAMINNILKLKQRGWIDNVKTSKS